MLSTGNSSSFRASATRPEETTRIDGDVSFLSRSMVAPRPRSAVPPLQPRVGEKRKRRDTLNATRQDPRGGKFPYPIPPNLSHLCIYTSLEKRPLLPAPLLASNQIRQTQSSSSGSSTSPVGLFSEGSNTSTEPATSDQGPSQSSQATEPAATPSLCSDNDPEKDDEHDRSPSTPPLILPSRSMYRFRGTGIPVTPSERSRSIILNRSLLLKPQEVEVQQERESEPQQEQEQEETQEETHHNDDDHPADYEDSFVPIHPVTPEDPADHSPQSTVFKKRLPVSPLPAKTLRKPHPPNRRRSTPHPKKLSLPPTDHADDDEEVLSPPPVLSFLTPPAAISTPGLVPQNHPPNSKAVMDTPDIFNGPPKQSQPRNTRPAPPPRSRIPVPSSRLQHKKSSSSELNKSLSSKKRMSLGEELWIAQQSDELSGEEEEEEDLHHGLYVGTGTRSKKEGFLAHGGAGGIPVFMGAGYVDGTEDEERQLEDDLNN